MLTYIYFVGFMQKTEACLIIVLLISEVQNDLIKKNKETPLPNTLPNRYEERENSFQKFHKQKSSNFKVHKMTSF